MERERIAQEERATLSRGRFVRPKSPAWTVDADSVTVSTSSGRTVSTNQIPGIVFFPHESPCSFLRVLNPFTPINATFFHARFYDQFVPVPVQTKVSPG